MPTDANNFYRSDQVTTQKVSFANQYQMQVVGNLMVKNALDRSQPYPAIVVGHPMGAVKEQIANLHATRLAEQSFVTLSIDLTFWGESEGQPRNAVSPDLYAEAFSAAADYLGSQPFVAAQAIATIRMYDMGATNRQGLRHSTTLQQRKQILAIAAAQRNVEFAGGKIEYTSGSVHKINEDSHPIEREFYDFHRTPRGEYTSPGSRELLTTHPTLSSNCPFRSRVRPSASSWVKRGSRTSMAAIYRHPSLVTRTSHYLSST
ncbi:alpha/beta hydrolase [Bremerella cremea]|uniref:alpha/beta hydrolase n=1 Tax=Bremerella cremea TaxID=1031537 RepID=UPI0031EF56A9